jgi:hypothetical protein
MAWLEDEPPLMGKKDDDVPDGMSHSRELARDTERSQRLVGYKND